MAVLISRNADTLRISSAVKVHSKDLLTKVTLV
jgi:hypothetical protein